MQWTELAIITGFAMVVAVGIQLFRAYQARRGAPTHIHGALMKRAEGFADRSPFLRNVCREFKANGHISDRQADAVRKALDRLGAK